MPKSRNKRKNKEKNIRIKQQQMNIANKRIRKYREPDPFDDKEIEKILGTNRLLRIL